MRIHLAQPNDAEEVYELFKTTWLDTYVNEEYDISEDDILSKYPRDKRQETIKKYKKFYKIMNNNPERFETNVFIYKEDEKIKGLVSINKKEPIEIGAVYILPESQGQGIGKSLMEFALNKIGDQEISIKVASYNNRAIEFYKNFGFEYYGEVEAGNGTLPSGKVIPEIELRRN